MVLRGHIALNIIDRTEFGHQSIQWSKMLEKYCYAVSFEKELFLTNNSIPISLNVQIMILIFIL